MKRFATSLAELSAIFEKNVVTLQKYGHKGCPCLGKDKDSKGRYNVTAIRKWMQANGYLEKRPPNPKGRGPQRQADIFEGTDTERLRRAQAKEREHKARIAELEEKRLREELHSVEECREQTRRRHEYMIGVLENWARSLGPELAGLTAVEVNLKMQRKVKELMREFAGK